MEKDTLNKRVMDLVKMWDKQVRHIKRLEDDLKKAENEQDQICADLGAAICPGDAKEGEVFNLWIRTEDMGYFDKEKMLNIKQLGSDAFNTTRYVIEWRESE